MEMLETERLILRRSENCRRSGGSDSILNQRSDVIIKKNCIFMMMEKTPSATGEFLRQMAFFISYNGWLPGYGIAVP
jgi:hypothetical protein